MNILFELSEMKINITNHENHFQDQLSFNQMSNQVNRLTFLFNVFYKQTNRDRSLDRKKQDTFIGHKMNN